jgi:uncharacterized membrane protein YkvA (DUF1232 family)
LVEKLKEMTMSDKKALPANTEKQVSMMSRLINQLQLVWLLLKDSRVSNWVKSVVPLSFVYTISPIDFIPDVILGVGQLDDLGVILLGLALFVKLCPPDLVEFYRKQIEFGPDPNHDGETVDATYRILDEE